MRKYIIEEKENGCSEWKEVFCHEDFTNIKDVKRFLYDLIDDINFQKEQYQDENHWTGKWRICKIEKTIVHSVKNK